MEWSGEQSRASFFEVYAQDCLLPALRPAVKYVLSVLAERHLWAARLLQYDEEVFTGLVLLLETHYLRSYDATFAENFYGLRRVDSRDVSSSDGPSRIHGLMQTTSRRLSPSKRFYSTLLLVGIPYIKHSLDRYYEKCSKDRELFTDNDGRGSEAGSSRGLGAWRAVSRGGGVSVDTPSGDNSDINSTGGSGTQRSTPPPWVGKVIKALKRLFVRLYPFAHAGFEGSIFVYQLLYLFGKARFYSPSLHLLGLEIHRLNVNDIRSQLAAQILRTRAVLSVTGDSGGSGGVLSLLARIFAYSQRVLFHLSPYILPTFIFVWKFLEWWYATEGHRAGDDSLPVPPPPKPVPPARDGISLPKDSRFCPLCRSVRSNPALAPSGYVFCYRCLFDYVQANARCPVTYTPANVDSIRKIYENV